MDDFCHFIKKHGDNQQLIQIANELTKIFEIKPCDLTKCSKLRRHYRRRTDVVEDNNDDIDIKFGFYSDFYDKIHHQIFHLFKMGLRINDDFNEENKENKISDNDNLDKSFLTKRDLIKLRRKQCGLLDLERYNKPNNKYNISITNTG